MSANSVSSRFSNLYRLVARLHDHMASYGYQHTEVPVIEPAELFLTRAGDQIIHKLFTFDRHGISLALRPEFTSPALRRYISQYSGLHYPAVRWQFSGTIFEDDPSDVGMQYERMSVGAECIGLAGVAADAELIAMAVTGCDAVGTRAGTLVLGHVQLVRALLSAYELDNRLQQFVLSHLSALRDPALGVEYVMSRFDALASGIGEPISLRAEADAQRAFELVLDSTERGATLGGRTQADIARRLLQKQRRASQRGQIIDVLRFLDELCAINATQDDAFSRLRRFPVQSAAWSATLDDWEVMVQNLLAHDIKVSSVMIQPGALRDWEYYSGMIFELYGTDGRHLAGGGRYDDFARLLGAPVDIPAVGFVYYLDQLMTVSTDENASC
ncbi:MAG: ATP phosphoribosyltransferase regulatory subunit [Chloroflexota bacterium]|nr:ATP phosphoribosyltransferase regulatory subunit [Chloroflexota bacterium]